MLSQERKILMKKATALGKSPARRKYPEIYLIYSVSVFP